MKFEVRSNNLQTVNFKPHTKRGKMERNFVILMLFTVLAFGSLFYVLSLYSGEDLTGMLSAISGDYKRREGSRFLTTADEGRKLAPPTRTGNCPMSTREGRLTVNAPSDATIRILYAETSAELECRTGGFTKNICRNTFKIKASKSGFKTFEKIVFLGAGQIATVDVDLKPGTSNELPCEGDETAQYVEEESTATEKIEETEIETTPLTEQLAESQPQETPTEQPVETSVNESTVQETPTTEQSAITPESTPTQEQVTLVPTEPTTQESTPVTEVTPTESPTPQTTDYPLQTIDQTPEETPVSESSAAEESTLN